MLQLCDSFRRLSGGNRQSGVFYFKLCNALSEQFPIILSENFLNDIHQRNNLLQKQSNVRS
jgi:hypothetical protein